MIKAENAEEKGEPKKTEEDGDETDKYQIWGRRRNGLHDNFNPAVYVQFLATADNDHTLMNLREFCST